MRKSFLLLVLFLTQSLMTFAGLRETPKQLLLVKEKQAEGKFYMAYDYEVGVEKPIINNWEEVKSFANEKCKSWGYRTVKFSERGRTRCILIANDGIYCDKKRVTYKCQCLEKIEELTTGSSK